MNLIKSSRYLNVVKRGGKNDFLLYHSLFGRLCAIDGNLMKLVSLFDSEQDLESFSKLLPKHLHDDVMGFITTLINKSFLIGVGRNEYDEIDSFLSYLHENKTTGRQVKIIQLVVSNLCNFSCKYCFVDKIYSSPQRKISQKDPHNRLMKKVDAISYISNVINLEKEHNDLNIQFFGGEPLTNWETIKGILDYYKKGQQSGLSINYSIVTNGSLITDETAQYFSKYDVAVILSFDSPSDNNRITKQGKSSLKLIKKSLYLLKKHRCNVVFNVSIVKQNFSNINKGIVDFALKYNVNELGILFDLDLSFYAQFTVDEIMKKFKSIYYYAKKKKVVLSGYWRSTLDNILSNSSYKRKGYKTCSATGSQLSIEPNGDVFACKGTSAYFGHIDDLASIFESDTYSNYINRTFRNSADCIDCELENLCSGICPGTLEYNYNDINTVVHPACELYKRLTLFLLHDLNEKHLETYQLSNE